MFTQARIVVAAADGGWSSIDVTNVVLVVFFGILAVAVAVIVYKREKRRVSVDFSVLSDIRLITSSAVESFSDQFEVSYNGRRLHYPRIVDVKVKNTGNTAIRGPDAYVQPIVIELEDNYRPIEAKVLEESVEDITGAIFEKQPNGTRTIAIRPTLFNEGEWFILRMLFDNKDSDVVGSHRIEGAPPMRRLDEAELSGYRRVVVPALWAVFVIGIGAGVVAGFATWNIFVGLLTAGTAFMVCCLAAAFITWHFLPSEVKADRTRAGDRSSRPN